ncbi:MAG: alpha/beta hydrolase, partial [Methanocorpusculum sp.]|nr:alpha/beta hydrolase [Methanocorpusculum sp.]
ETDELVQGIHPGDLIAVSAPEGGELLPALYLLEMVRTYHTPVIALAKTHPAGKRLSYVVSANERIELRGDICRGTHPEQHLLCAAGEFAGMAISADGDFLVVENPAAGITAEQLSWKITLLNRKVL